MTQETMTRRGPVLFALLLLAFAAPLQAASVYLEITGGLTYASPGDTIQVELWTADFGADDGTVGGGVDAFYDPAVLDYVGWVDTSGSLIPTPGLPQDLVGEVNAIQVDTALIDWLPIAPTQSGILTFTVLPGAPSGFTGITLAENDAPLGGFFATNPISFIGTTIQIGTAAVVPLPGGLLLLGSALGLLGAARRRLAG